MLARYGIALIVLMALAGLAAWIVDQPGTARFTWLGYEIAAPAPLLVLLLALLALGLVVLAWIVAWAAALPQRSKLKRQARGQAAFAAGMVAVAAGEPGRATKLAAKAAKDLDDPTLARLLAAHTAQLTGDPEAARKAFTALAADPATAFLGLRGLISDARQRGDRDAALPLARKASALRPASPFAAEAELRLLLEAGDWAAARTRLEAARKRKAAGKADADRLAALLDLAQAQEAAEAGHGLEAAKLVRHASKWLPEHVGRAAILTRSASDTQSRHDAQDCIRRLWPLLPSQALARLWQRLEDGQDRAPDIRMQRARMLAESAPDAPESHLLLAETALAARDFGLARAELEQAESLQGSGAWSARIRAGLARESDGDESIAERWQARASRANEPWLCRQCGAGHAEWAMRCQACDGFDSISPRREAPPETAPGPQAVAPLLLDGPKL